MGDGGYRPPVPDPPEEREPCCWGPIVVPVVVPIVLPTVVPMVRPSVEPMVAWPIDDPPVVEGCDEV